MISAGPDGIFFSAVDGPADPGRPIGTDAFPYQQLIDMGPDAVAEFDDIVITG